jgi:hypothetical protein
MNKEALSPYALQSFCGTIGYTWGAFRAVLLSDGAVHVTTNGAGWLFDAIGSHVAANPLFKKALAADPDLDRHFWYLERDPLNASGAILTMRKDKNAEPFITQKIEYTDFPLDMYPEGFCIYAGIAEIEQNGKDVQKFLLMLPSEY